MRLDRLEIAGFLHFSAPAILDLRTVPMGLVAIVGPNGHGKTRLIDAGIGSLYGPGAQTQAFPSRDGTLAEYATARDAYIETLWNVDGIAYRVRVNVDGVKRNTDAVIDEDLHGYGDFFKALNDGKTSTFREEVAKIFPSRRQVLASAFAAQGRQGSFVSLDNKGKMDLFSEMLALAHYAEKAETAKRCVVAVEKVRAALLAVRSTLEREIGPATMRATLQAEAASKQAALDNVHVDQVLSQNEVTVIETTRAHWTALAVEHSRAMERLAALQGKRHDLGVETQRLALMESTVAGVFAAAVRAAQARTTVVLTRLDAKLVTAKAAHETTVQDRTERIANNASLIAQADAIRAAVIAQQSDAAALTGAIDEERTARERQADAVKRHAYAEKCVTFVATATTALATAREQAAMIETVPCGGEGPYAACRFLRAAAEAREKIPALETAAGPFDLLVEQTAEIGVQVTDAETAVSAAVAEVKAINQRLAEHTRSKLAASLDVAEEKIAGYRREIEKAAADWQAVEADIREQRERAQEDLRVATADAQTTLDLRLTEIATGRQAVDVNGVKLQADLIAVQADVMRTADAATQLDAADARLRAMHNALQEIAAQVARLDAELAENARHQEQLSVKEARLAVVIENLRLVDADLVDWSLLVKACSRDGLPKLEVDAAGPTVSSLCNDLLGSCYGTRFTVEVVTQVARADGKGLKEQFDVRVFDNQYGGEPRSISDLSGGERVVVEEALRGAIGLFVNARNQHPILTCWRDETTGALDPANVPRYVAMLRRIQQLGGFQHVLFVTHNAEAAAMADAQVVVEEGQPTVVLPPYREAA